MDTSKITHKTVKQAIDALQASDKKTWFSLFTEDAGFSDDGNSMDFTSFFDNAFRHKEKFTSIDEVKNDGKEIHGNFFAGQWGTFKVFFKFKINEEGKISKLDIGQAK